MIAVLLLLAIPADLRLSLHVGEHHIEKIDWRAESVETEGPLRAELLPSGNELLLEPSAKGVGRAFVFARREVRVVEVFIDTRLPPPPEKPVCVSVAVAGGESAHCRPAAGRSPVPIPGGPVFP